MFEITVSIAILWALGIVTFAVYKKFTKELEIPKNFKFAEPQELKELKKKLESLSEDILKIKAQSDEVRRIAEDSKKLLTQSSIAATFVPRTKRVELGN